MSRAQRKRRKLAPGETFILTPRRLLTHDTWVSQTATARVIFLDMCVFHNGSNNGAIGYGTRTGGRAAKCSPMTAWRALNALREAGLVRLRRRGCFSAHDKQAAEWEIAIFVKKFASSAPEWAREQSLLIQHLILKSTAYRTMSSPAKVFLVEAMRRYNGSNNGDILLGGEDGRFIGLSRNITERAIAENVRAGFLVETTPNPGRGRPRTWRLTMYKLDRSKPTMDFLRVAKQRPGKSDGITSGDENVVSVSTMVTAAGPPFATEDHGEDATRNPNNNLAQTAANLPVTAHDTETPSVVTAHDTHIEDHPLRGLAGTASLPVAASLPPSAPPSRPSGPRRKPPWDELEKAAETANSTEETTFAKRGATKARIAGGRR